MLLCTCVSNTLLSAQKIDISRWLPLFSVGPFLSIRVISQVSTALENEVSRSLCWCVLLAGAVAFSRLGQILSASVNLSERRASVVRTPCFLFLVSRMLYPICHWQNSVVVICIGCHQRIYWQCLWSFHWKCLQCFQVLWFLVHHPWCMSFFVTSLGCISRIRTHNYRGLMLFSSMTRW